MFSFVSAFKWEAEFKIKKVKKKINFIYSGINLSADALQQFPGLSYSVRARDTELISSGRFVNFVGNQVARSTDLDERKSGKLKALMPTLPSDYYYSLTNNHKKGEYGRFNLSPKMKAILNASEGFFVDSGGCRKYFKYGWD